MHLVEEPSVVDPTYIEDFLLTYRTFLSNPMEVGRKLLDWFQVDSLRDTVSPRGFGLDAASPCSTVLKEKMCVFTSTIWICFLQFRM